MFGAATAAPPARFGPRPGPLVFSLLVHGAILGMVAFGPSLGTSARPRSLYEQVIKPHEHELVWYSFPRKLPEVSPLEKADRPPGAELKTPGQTIVSNPKQSDLGKQMIWRPLPQIKPQPEVASPNILAFRMPLIQPPPPGPPRKIFTPPTSKPQKPALPAPELPEPPKLQSKVEAAKLNPALTANLAAALENRPKPRNFVPPVPRPERRAATPALPEAPGLATSLRSERVPMLAENMAAPLANKPQARTFVPPPAPGRPSAGPVALPDAPKIAVALAHAGERNAAIEGAALAPLANKPKPRAFVPPVAPGGGNGPGSAASVPILQDAPSLNAAAMPSSNVNVAVVGLNPAAKLMGPLPDTSREARFSAGPDANGGSGGGNSAASTALSVPGLLVRGNDAAEQNSPPANPLLIARSAPTSRSNLEAAANTAAQAAGQSAGSGPPEPASSEIHLAPPPDPRFNGRDVYTLAVQMPNITSYVGSWIMWFAELTPGGMHRAGGGLRAPVPTRKVDPKYYRDAIAERVEGKVQLSGVLRKNGRVDMVRILKGVDPRLDRSAAEALQKWEFAPAERDGVPVEVDVIAEIPFILPPQTKP
jgi:TonB family protein